MKHLLIGAFALFLTIGFAACQKCTTCTASKNGAQVSSDNKCGEDAELTTWEKQYKDTQTAAGNTVECTSN